jgi:hypothetical protein
MSPFRDDVLIKNNTIITSLYCCVIDNFIYWENNMEHRTGQRFRISLLVGIHSQQLSLGNFTNKNISTGGIGIVDKGRQLSKGNFIQLQFYGNHQRFILVIQKLLLFIKIKVLLA